jgi:hemolysin III
MRRADHATIFVAIAGTYTAVASLALGGWAQVLVLCLVWIGAAVGITLRQVWLDAPKWAIALPYVVVGWCALAVMPQLLHGLGGAGFGLLFASGAVYSAGAVVYALRKPSLVPAVFGYHELFHACTVVGAALGFAMIAGYALHTA